MAGCPYSHKPCIFTDSRSIVSLLTKDLKAFQILRCGCNEHSSECYENAFNVNPADDVSKAIDKYRTEICNTDKFSECPQYQIFSKKE
jgi:hypothetical protein